VLLLRLDVFPEDTVQTIMLAGSSVKRFCKSFPGILMLAGSSKIVQESSESLKRKIQKQ
jgi:hypothetical protein